MSKDLHGKRIAFLLTDGFEQVEMIDASASGSHRR